MTGQAIQTSRPNARGGITSVLFRGQSLPVMLAARFAVGAAPTLAMPPISVKLGGGSFWDFPAGTVPDCRHAQRIIASRTAAASGQRRGLARRHGLTMTAAQHASPTRQVDFARQETRAVSKDVPDSRVIRRRFRA